MTEGEGDKPITTTIAKLKHKRFMTKNVPIIYFLYLSKAFI